MRLSPIVSRRVVLKSAVAGTVWWLTGCSQRAAELQANPRESLHALQDEPFNGEPPSAALSTSWITPQELFYVRSHAAVPAIDVGQYRLKVSGMVKQPLTISLDELRREFPQRRATATLTCAGNRRAEHGRIKKISGVQWTIGAIGNAEWTGAPLAAALARAGIAEGAKHVWFNGLDRVSRPTGEIPFGASIPLDKALAGGAGEALLAYEMNGRTLPPHHGYPLRTVVPGYIGARSVKWVGEIVVSDRMSENHFVAADYKIVPAEEEAALKQAPPLMEMNLNSAICAPTERETLHAGPATLSGYALAPGAAGRVIRRVEISMDGGAIWREARIVSPVQEYCWVLWQANVDLTRNAARVVVRATDSEGNLQPQTVAWNAKGYMYNAWHAMDAHIE